MNGNSNEQRQLELATTGSLPAGTALEAETGELREGWLALTQPLAERNAGRESVSFAAQMARELTAAPAVMRRQRASRPVAAIIASAGAVAAAALVALTVWLMSAPNTQLEIAAGNAVRVPAANEAAGAIFAVADWNDPLDAQITRVEEQVAELAIAAPRLDTSLSALDRRMSELAEDLDAGSL